MIEELRQIDTSTCRWCGEAITLYEGDLMSRRWSHDSSGRIECPNSTYATPRPESTERTGQ